MGVLGISIPKSRQKVRDATCDVVDSAEALSSQEHVKWVADDRDSIELVSYEGPYQAICFETIMSPIRTIWEDAVQVLKGERFDPTKTASCRSSAPCVIRSR